MLLNTSDILTAQLTAIQYPNITAETESGHQILIQTNQKQRKDPLFWESMRAILKAQLWIPVSKQWHQLVATDWLATMPVES
ncbi:hypothetical protein [Lacticaseibacillus saniviri]|uniref:Uncharacterized protein n=1 Tax=Lacticaseibacillus saniviri JCM 17471 = DSM 24301 TaxID=1293598 RepID=A0A0R2MTH4_9LACO|nr:hypothetical protein [Lacticaseibacillus saniviri]KRO16926.1 hypothetical protein IV56_GL000613 [Lacticaseibacillus saniviri JCM 17471 = DSM 24301]MCG4281967.1 hypothetical protein [Lacticaseibacillus saniviri]